MEIGKLFDVAGKQVLVTGGGRGIGLYIAQGFVANGAVVYITSRDHAACTATAAELTHKGPGKCIALPSVDISNAKECALLISHLQKYTDKLHVLVNNSGASWGEPFAKYSETGWDKVMDLNLKGLFFVTQATLPILQKAATNEDPARIINIGSIFGIAPQQFPTYAYDISKAGVHHLTKKLATELGSGEKKITVNAIAPGVVPTKMSKGLTVYKSEGELLPILNRTGTATDMAGAAIYLASRAGAWTTGAIISVDGGGPAKL
jgi:NAD(P)-dependent dehydrogenase (short-subunit alcohol dehydrogenase family)